MASPKTISARRPSPNGKPRVIQAAKPTRRKSADPGDNPKTLNIEATATIEIAAKAENGQTPLPRFKMVANTGNPMKLEGWRFPVVIALDGLNVPSQARPVRMNHDEFSGVGHTESIGIEDGKVVAAGVVSRDTEAAREVVASAANNFPWQASVGTSVDDSYFVKAGDKVVVNGKQFDGPLNVARKTTLNEISLVDLGADHRTEVKIAAKAKDGEEEEPETETGSDTEAVIARAKAERSRQDGIRAIVEEELSFRGANIPEIERISAMALDEGWTIKDTKLELLSASRPKAPAVRRQDAPSPKVLEASLCMACGISDERLAKDRDYGPDVVARAWPLRTRGLRGMLAAALEAAGVRVPHGNQELLNALIEHQGIRAAGFSTINVPGIVGSVANKVLLQAFTDFPATYPLIADQADYSNFLTHTMYRLGVGGEFELVPATGEIKHGTLSQSPYTNKLDTYGKMLTIPRQDIINDDLNAFRSLTTQLARKARVAVEKALYNAIMESVDSFYSAAKGNKLTGALGIDTLGAAEAALLGMIDDDGTPIYGIPRYLVVPTALKSLGDQIYTSTTLNETTTTNKPRPADNPFKGRFEVISSPFLSLAGMDGASATTWYLLADPMTLPAFQVAYLDGKRAPTVDTADAAFNTLGFSMRCYWDFSVAPLDYRGAVKNV